MEGIIRKHKDKKILVFTSFKRVAKRIARRFKGLLVVGGMDDKEKARIINKFKNTKEENLLVATDTLTYGISLDEADVLVHFDIPWSVGKLIQRTDRIYRISSTRDKFVYYFVAKGVEEKVWKILQEKKEPV